MTAEIIDGNRTAAEIISSFKSDLELLAQKGCQPRFVAIKANDNKGSASYAKAQEKHCQTHGVCFLLEDLGAGATVGQIQSCIEKHNNDDKTSTIMLHMPLPKGVSGQALTEMIKPAKDAEGMHPQNLGKLFFETDPIPGPCTAVGAVKMAEMALGNLKGTDAVIIGRSQIVGRPAALMLMGLHSTVTVTHTRTKNLAEITRKADLVIAAAGAVTFRWNAYKRALAVFTAGEGEQPEPCDLSYMVTAEMVKPGAAVIDVGVNRVPAGFTDDGQPLKNPETGKTKLVTVGDVDFEGVQQVAGYITSPKGGTGPVTNAILLRNTVFAAKKIVGL